MGCKGCIGRVVPQAMAAGVFLLRVQSELTSIDYKGFIAGCAKHNAEIEVNEQTVHAAPGTLMCERGGFSHKLAGFWPDERSTSERSGALSKSALNLC